MDTLYLRLSDHDYWEPIPMKKWRIEVTETNEPSPLTVGVHKHLIAQALSEIHVSHYDRGIDFIKKKAAWITSFVTIAH